MKYVTKPERLQQGAEIGERISYLRRNQLMSQEDLAEKLGRKRTEVTMFETGARSIDANTIKEIAKIFNVSTDYLLGTTDFESSDINEIGINELTGLSLKAIKNLSRLKKYHDGYLLPLINYLLEQEALFPNEYYDVIDKDNIESNGKPLNIENYAELSQALKKWNNKNSTRVISKINSYFNMNFENEERLYITNNSIKKRYEFEDWIDEYVSTKEIICSEDIANVVLLKEIEDLLKNAKDDYLSDNTRNEV